MPERPTLRTAAEYREMAVKARNDAAVTDDGTLKMTYVHLAITYDEMAVQVEKIRPAIRLPRT